MNEIDINKNTGDFDEEINLRELIRVLLEGKWIIVFFTAFVSTVAVIYSLLLPNIYESKALLVPADSSNNLTRSLGNYSDLAGLAGIPIPSINAEENSVKALEKISSLSFFESNILNNIFLPDLMAMKSWSPETNTIIYDENIYDTINNTWVRSYSYPKKQIPSAQESFEVFKTKHLSLTEDKTSGFITLAIKHQSPFVAKKWVDLVINEVNSFYRQKDKSESEKAISYLNRQISIIGLSEIKQAIAQLLSEEIKKLTLIEANEYYVFDFIDPPAVMEKKSEPKRALICIISAILGGLLSIFLVLIKHYVLLKKLHES